VTVCVAVGLTVLALAGAVLLRPHSAAPAATGSPGAARPAVSSGLAATLQCDSGPCQLLASRSVSGSTVQLLANSAATSGRVRISTGQGLDSVFETTISNLGASLTAQSLTCVDGQTSACLVSGTAPDGTAGEVFINTGGDWSRADAPYFSSAGYLGLTGSSTPPEIITAQSDCDSDLTTQCAQSPVYVEVFTVTGQSIGCSRSVSRLDRLPGWPTVSVARDSLHPC
jgi:hypothetical protein